MNKEGKIERRIFCENKTAIFIRLSKENNIERENLHEMTIMMKTNHVRSTESFSTFSKTDHQSMNVKNH